MAKKEAPIEWIGEEEAAKMVGLTPLYFRRQVREGNLTMIGYSKPSRYCHRYNKADIEAYLLSVSTMVTA